jgi:cardiolipin synthase
VIDVPSIVLITTVIGYVLPVVLVPIVLLQRKPYPVSTVAWLLAIFSLPIVGALLFLLFGINRVDRRARLKRQSDLALAAHLPVLPSFEALAANERDPVLQGLKRLAMRTAGTQPFTGNRVEILSDTRRTLGLLVQAIEAARQSVHLEYYIWQPDKTGLAIRDLLVRRAREGVRIRFLFDGIGSLKLGHRFLTPMKDAGIQVARFLPGNTFRERWSINLRNHRKLAIVDGRIGFTGGMNIGSEYIGRNSQHGFWRDTHLRFEGPIVPQLQQVFAEDWFFTTGEQLVSRDLYPTPDVLGDDEAQVVASGPEHKADAFHTLFFAAINAARDRITLATSYFVPTPALLMALQTAAQRGVRVRLLMSARGAYKAMVIAAQAYYEPLLEVGCEIHDYNRGLMHSKTLTIDGKWSVVGSANFDTRSLQINFEAGVVLYGQRAAALLEEQFADDLRHSTRIVHDEWVKRGLWQRLQEQVLVLFSPVL